ncbi:MAG: malto-oligosyltrehalose synthase, partial [Propionibacteriaceae bacterium]|nr:malto-oligosyltrehalose synthase [Propionibacteriaceae bacterium]
LIGSDRLRFADLELADGAERVLTLDGQPYPLVPGTEQLPLAEAVAAQRYSLQRWQGNHTRLTHRRFFDIVTLIGLRQELPAVFDATHALLLELFETGQIDGFRVDHPDGLADPQAYFERLDAVTGGAWVVAEKILSGDEQLPPAWPVAGTTGYEAAWRFDAVQLDPAAAAPLAELARRTDERPAQAWPEVAIEAKRYIADGSLAIDVDRLIRLAQQLDPSLRAGDLRPCLREFLVAFDRYRAYVRPGYPTGAEDAAVLATAAGHAAESLPGRLHPMLAWLHALAAGEHGDEGPAGEFMVRFQQVSGALVAKGVEDTAFYRWTQLLTLCEVGGDPGGFGLSPTFDPAEALPSMRTADLHTWLGRVNSDWPATMTLGSTHDSKRSEDVRARIAVISEHSAEWAGLVSSLNPLASGLPAPIRTILWQTLAGTWTPTGPIDADRVVAHCIKAGREQKLWTSWFSPDDTAEAVVERVVPPLMAEPTVRASFAHWIGLTADSVRTNTLAIKLVQLTALGVADIYQGQETVRLSLTDPDNRRAVDYETLRGSLAAVKPRASDPAALSLAEEKMLLTSIALALRQRHPGAFVGGVYLPLESTTAFAWGFARGDEP